METDEKSVIVIGAGFAGLAAGIYARLNGYSARIFEMHNQPGGLCTSWNRKGFTFDGCIHWLVGSSPRSGMHDLWEETGIIQGRQFINMDEYFRVEDHATGRTLIFHTDVDQLEKHLIEFSPQDRAAIKEFTDGIRMCLIFDSPSKHDSFFTKLRKRTAMASFFITRGKTLQKWMHTTAAQFSGRFEDPVLREAFLQMWIPEFSMFFMLFTFAYLHNRNAGYPLGGSKPMSEAMESRFKDLGGEIFYNSRVTKILTDGNRATGIRLEDGTEMHADRIISAADGHSTLFGMLDDKFGDDRTRMPYTDWVTFPPLIYISLGVNRRFDDMPRSVSGFTFRLSEPVAIAGKFRSWLPVHIYNHDSTLAPSGKTAVVVMLESDYDYWKALEGDRNKYLEKKDEIAGIVISLLGQQFPGISADIEVTDVATPLTFERYTGNWKGSFEGWLITPSNSGVILKPMSQKIAGLENFYMCGQWVEPGGGLPTAVMSGKRLIKAICREDGKKFRSEA
jgi:phytoene dehydrogenase-like protein